MIKKILKCHWLVTFTIMCLSALAFGLCSVNLFTVFHANFDFISQYGGDALREGAVMQLLELIAYGMAATVFYIIFKACEKILVERLVY